MSVRVLLVLLVVGTLVAAAAIVLNRPGSGTLDLEHGIALDEPRPLPEFELLDQRARPFTRAELDGRWTLLFAGFTHCPDICPTTLATLAELEARLQEAGRDLRVVFLSLDPDRDDPATLAEYVGHFSPRFVGATGETAEIDRLVAALGLAYIVVPYGEDSYTVDHSAALVLIDPRARTAGYFKPPLRAEALAADLAPVVGPRP
ncbi:MAG TPA: SCO family protein [Gammaproteobacteria bacterium]|nr:SCO family protein [Gammaproteobacteria bacterium]